MKKHYCDELGSCYEADEVDSLIEELRSELAAAKASIEKLEKDKATLIEASATAAIQLGYLASPVAGTPVFKDFMSVLDTLDKAEKTVKE